MENKSDNNCMLDDNRFQSVYVELKDGTVGAFLGPVLFEGDPNGLVKHISFSKPQSIPDNQTWSDLCEKV